MKRVPATGPWRKVLRHERAHPTHPQVVDAWKLYLECGHGALRSVKTRRYHARVYKDESDTKGTIESRQMTDPAPKRVKCDSCHQEWLRSFTVPIASTDGEER